MNERIEEFSNRADKLAVAEVIANDSDYFDAYHEKFAELIVKECIEVVSKSCASPTGAQALMGHFGVER